MAREVVSVVVRVSWVGRRTGNGGGGSSFGVLFTSLWGVPRALF